jgi:hypothetical protein
VNAAIRRLMEAPASRERTEEYVRLLALWTEATGDTSRWEAAA